MAIPASLTTSSTATPATVISIRDLKVHCSNCSMRELCLPMGLDADDLKQIDALLATRIKLHKGDTLYRAGDPFAALYAIRLGSLKTTVLAEDGREQVSGYHMLGDIIGLDGIATERHGCQAVALEDTEVCVMPFERIEELARTRPAAAAQSAPVAVARDRARPEHHAACSAACAPRSGSRSFLLDSRTATGGAATRRPSSCCA